MSGSSSPESDRPGACPTDRVLRELLAGTIDSRLLDSTQQHLDQCPRCPARLDELLRSPADPLGQALQGSPTLAPFANEANCRAVVQQIASGIGTPLPRTSSSVVPQRLGRYQVDSVLAEGGMGIVYRATHVDLHKSVALKLLRPMVIYVPEVMQRFRREFRTLGRLQHHNLVAAYDAGVTDGTPFLVMEFIDGVDLSRLLKRSGPLTLANSCEIIRQAASGLQHAWSKGVVHRDVKPSNLMLTRDSHGQALIKVLDLGLARLFDPRSGIFPEISDLTSEGQLIGTRGYMSPEQERDSHDVDCRADVYALGVTLHELLTGKRPPGPVTAERPLPPPEATLPPEIHSLLQSMLAADRENRPASPGDVAHAMSPIAAGHRLGELATQ